MNTIETKYGPLTISGTVECYKSGAIKSCSAVRQALFRTSAGECVPQYSTDDVRKKTVQALTFHKNGVVKSLPLENSTLVSTPVGMVPAELVTFHTNGTLHRVFPLNGKLSGYWTQEDETELAEPLTIATPAGALTAKCISLCFDEAGTLKSITLWPGESVALPTPVGTLEARIGVRFRPDGSVSSLEPAAPVRVPTPVGEIQAFDPDAVGVNGDSNSLAFTTQGTVCRVVTTLTRLVAADASGNTRMFAPELRESICGNGEHEVVPMEVAFAEGIATVRATPDAQPEQLSLAEYTIRSEPHTALMEQSFAGLRCSM